MPKILIVDDNDLITDMLSAKFSARGIEADCAENAVGAYAKLATGEYNLVLMDVGLPVHSGIAAAISIHQMGYTTPIVAMTGGLYRKDLERIDEARFDKILQKPLTSQQIEELISKYLS